MIRDILPCATAQRMLMLLGLSRSRSSTSVRPLSRAAFSPLVLHVAWRLRPLVYTDAPSLHTQGALPSGAAAPERVSARGREHPGGTYPNPRHRSAFRPPVSPSLPACLLPPSLPQNKPQSFARGVSAGYGYRGHRASGPPGESRDGPWYPLGHLEHLGHSRNLPRGGPCRQPAGRGF